jgi:hypothetical protein
VPSDDVLREIKNSRISSIRISDYGFNAEKVKLIKNKLEAYGIQNSIYHFVTEKSMWADCGGIDMPKLENHVVERLFRKCLFKGCLSVENGFVSRCSRATVAHLVQKFNLEKKDGVNVRNNFTKREFLKFAYGNYPVTACYYCFGTSHKEIPAAEQFTVEELRQLKQVCYEI